MAIIYDEEYLDEVKRNVNLVDYIGKDIVLTPKGKDYFGHCPKHVDKTPSFSVNPDKNIYHCFSCGRGFSIIDYLQQYEGMTFEKAVTKASKIAGMKTCSMCQSMTVIENRKIKRRYESLKRPKTEHVILSKSEYERYRVGKINEWLTEGIHQDMIDLFEIRIDDKSNRIVYPVYDINNNLINIKGRTRIADYKKLGICKYMNYYPVGTMDYFQGFNITGKHIAKTKEIKIFESIKSVMKLCGYGIWDSVSAEKHTLTPEQMSYIISSDINTVVFCYDSDVSYDEKAVKENINLLKRFVNVYIIEDDSGLLGGKDAKNSPIDKGIKVWEELYSHKKKIL